MGGICQLFVVVAMFGRVCMFRLERGKKGFFEIVH